MGKLVALSAGIKDFPAQRAVRALEQASGELDDRVTELESNPSSGGAVTSVSAGDANVVVIPTTGAVEVSLAFVPVTLPIAESEVTGLVADLASKATLPIAQSDVTGLTTALAAKAPVSRLINTTAPLSGGGDLSADRTLSIATVSSGAPGVAPASGGGTHNFLRADATWAPASIAGTWPQCGGGGDGALHFDGTTTVLGMAPSGSKYTLSRDIHPSSVVIDSGVTIFCANFRIICRGSITGAGSSVSLIHNNGNSAPVAVSGSIVSGAAVAAGFYLATVAGGFTANSSSQPPVPYGSTTGGVAGGTGSSAGAGNGNTPTARMLGGSGGGVSIPGTSGTAGQPGGGSTAFTSPNGYDAVQMMTGCSVNGSSHMGYGAGGSPGGSTAKGAGGTNPTGGGGGAGGGCLMVSAASLSGLTISANGGRGADGFGATAGPGGGNAASGGGGGGGGLLQVYYGTQIGCVFTADGGGGGTAAIVGTGATAGNGGAGSAGWVLLFNLSGDGT